MVHYLYCDFMTDSIVTIIAQSPKSFFGGFELRVEIYSLYSLLLCGKLPMS